jgi:ABC-type Fe3+ transport system permease subunit
MKSPFTLSLLVTLCALFAVLGWFHSAQLGWQFLLSRRVPGMFGTSAGDFSPETPLEKEARLRADRALLSELRWSFRLSAISATLSLLGAGLLAWRSRRDPWRRQLAVGVLASIALGVFVFVLFV